MESIRSKVADYKSRISAQQARLEEAQSQVRAVEDRILKEAGVSANDLIATLEAAEHEVQVLGGKILEVLNQP